MNFTPDAQLHITIETAEASDSGGFVGRVMIGDQESYRTIRAFPAPGEALAATQEIVGEVLGNLLAGQEWRTLADELGHKPRREDLGLRLMGADHRWRADLPPAPVSE
jgi:hypothetical protein